MIEVQNATRRFGRELAVDAVRFAVRTGEVAGLLGSNGAGKTTTIRMVTGCLAPDSGLVRVAGHDMVREGQPGRRALGYLPESTPGYAEMSAGDYLRFRARLSGLGRRDVVRCVARAADRCALGGVLRKRIGHLSKGYRQRVGLAAAIVHEPPAIVLDEPTSGLDPEQIRATRDLVRELAQRHAVLLSSHVLSEVEAMCDRVIIMARGRVRASGTPADLRARLGPGACIIEARPGAGGAASLRRALQAVPGAGAIDERALDGGLVRLRVTPAARGADLREPLAAAAAGEGAALREVSLEAASLEAVFMAVVGEDEPPGRARDGEPA
jgi:ABC-2 type transport system ATP-binding protein